MGKKAAQLIIQQIMYDNADPVFKTIVMPTELIIRNSSKNIKKVWPSFDSQT
jgi:DNA-binding LacI/PurR family transcriptional regulator